MTVDTHTHGGKLCIISTVTFFVSLALNCAYMIGKNTKYSTGGNHNHNDETTLKEVEEALIESAKEADRQKLFVEKQSENLKRRLHSVKGELLCCVVLSRDYSCDDDDDDEGVVMMMTTVIIIVMITVMMMLIAIHSYMYTFLHFHLMSLCLYLSIYQVKLIR